jgi:hypothetical protein
MGRSGNEASLSVQEKPEGRAPLLGTLKHTRV